MSKLEPRKNLLKIQSYKAGESKLAGFEKSYKLASNEGAFGAPPSAMKAYKEFDRITSYNVCYTKLLRTHFPSLK